MYIDRHDKKSNLTYHSLDPWLAQFVLMISFLSYLPPALVFQDAHVPS